MIVLSTLVLAIWVYLFFLHARFWRMDYRSPADAAPRNPCRVAVLIPARNEANTIEHCVKSVLGQRFSGTLHLFVVDDNSTDSTASIALEMAQTAGISDRLTAIAGTALPPAWTGKVWAMQQAWEAVRNMNPDFVLLTDADIEHAPNNLGALLAQSECGYDLVSLMVKLRCETFAEKLLIPAFVYFFFLIYPPARIADPHSKVAGAAGGCILLRANWLEQIGGFTSIRDEIIDDCSLAAQVKHAGGKLWLGLSESARSVRGYGTFANMSRMIARTAFNQLRILLCYWSRASLACCSRSRRRSFCSPLRNQHRRSRARSLAR